jgi:hypothetical protein
MAQSRPHSCKGMHTAGYVTMAAMNQIAIAPGCLALCLLAACSSSQPASGVQPEAPPQPLTGLSAVFHMYQVARTSWAADAQVVKMSSMRPDGVPVPPPGEAAAWEATFYSPSLGRARSYTDSIVEQLPDLHKDVFAGPHQSFTGDSFPIAAVKIDTESAYRTALAKAAKAGKAGEQYAGKPVLVLLEKNPKYGDPVWRIVWGESVSTASLSIIVDASTGEYLATMY